MLFVFLLVGVLVASFGEYLAHRLMHEGWFQGKVHAAHHMENASHGWVREFGIYIKPSSVPIIVIGGLLWYFLSGHACSGWILGSVGQVAWTALTHELCHTDPDLVFWVRPVHYFHHEHNQWQCNFAFTNTVWDRLFGTWQDDPTWKRGPFPWRKLRSLKLV